MRLRTWAFVALASVMGCGGVVAGGADKHADAGAPSTAASSSNPGDQADASGSVTPSADAGAGDDGSPTTTECVIPAAANYGQQSPTDTGCWAETSDPVRPCSAGTYPLTCGNPSTPPPEFGCGMGFGGPPHNNFYCCPCGGLVDGGGD